MRAKTNVDSIRVNTGAKRIQVNDDGDCIVLNFADQSLPSRYFTLLEDLNTKRDAYIEKAKEIDAAKADEMERFIAYAALNLEIHQYMREQVDGLFGADTCKKVFGDIVPSIDLYEDFFTQLSPYFEKYALERKAKLQEKYNPERTGNV